MKWFSLLLINLSLFGVTNDKYFDLLSQTPKTHGMAGSAEKGEIEILKDPLLIEEAENTAMARLLDKGVAPKLAWEWSRVGIIAEDQYLYWLRDGVRFPSGDVGTYDRIFWRSLPAMSAGVAVFPYLADQKVVLILHFRHATRSWELEIPRGMVREGETARSAAARELLEETGYLADDSLLLGTLAVDSGILGSLIPVIACKAVDPIENSPDFSEAIHSTVLLSIDEIKQALIKGFWDVPLGEQTVRAAVRDPFLAYGYLQLKLRHWQD